MVRNDCGQNTKILANRMENRPRQKNIDLGKKVTVSDGNTGLRKDTLAFENDAPLDEGHGSPWKPRSWHNNGQRSSQFFQSKP